MITLVSSGLLRLCPVRELCLTLHGACRFAGQESYVAEQIEENQPTWFPIGRALQLGEDTEIEVE